MNKRRRVAIEKIESQAARNVCFSKRRKGLFSKAEQLSRLNPNVSVAAVVFSPAGTPYTCGDTSSVFGRYLASSASTSTANLNEISALLSVDISNLKSMAALQSHASNLQSLRLALVKNLEDRKRNEKFVRREIDRETPVSTSAVETSGKINNFSQSGVHFDPFLNLDFYSKMDEDCDYLVDLSDLGLDSELMETSEIDRGTQVSTPAMESNGKFDYSSEFELNFEPLLNIEFDPKMAEYDNEKSIHSETDNETPMSTSAVETSGKFHKFSESGVDFEQFLDLESCSKMFEDHDPLVDLSELGFDSEFMQTTVKVDDFSERGVNIDTETDKVINIGFESKTVEDNGSFVDLSDLGFDFELKKDDFVTGISSKFVGTNGESDNFSVLGINFTPETDDYLSFGFESNFELDREEFFYNDEEHIEEILGGSSELLPTRRDFV